MSNELQKESAVRRWGKVLLSILYVVLLACVMAWLTGLLMGVVDAVRTSGTRSATVWFPYFDPTPVAQEPFRRYAAGTVPGFVEDLIQWNNMYFRGYTRFGSGLGFVIGAVYAATTFKFDRPGDRLPAVCVAGLISGARSMLMIASAPISAIAGGVICSVVAAGLAIVYAHDTRVPRMPLIDFNQR